MLPAYYTVSVLRASSVKKAYARYGELANTYIFLLEKESFFISSNVNPCIPPFTANTLRGRYSIYIPVISWNTDP